MRKLWIGLVWVIVLGLGGCGSSREPLDNEGVKKNMTTVDYYFQCSTIKGDYYACAFTDFENAFVYMEPDGVLYLSVSDGTAYSFNKAKIIEGNSDEKEVKAKYQKVLSEADVKEKEIVDTLTSEYNDYKKSAEAEKAELENKEYGAGERVSIQQNGDEVAAFTFNSAKATNERNEYDDSGAQQVVMINYTFENIDVEDDLFLSWGSMTVIGDDGTVANIYPISGEYAQPCPRGAKSTGDEAYGFKTVTSKVKIRVQMYINGEKVTRNFMLDVN